MVAAEAFEATASAAVRLDIEQVSHGFRLHGAPLPVLDAIDLSIAPGEFVALLGPSGCGKSTLLRLLAGLDRPNAGRLLVDGRPVERPDPSRILVFQAPTLYPWRTVRQNVAVGLEARKLLPARAARIDEALNLVGLTKFGDALPHQLSGGMAQRAALARALVNDPALLLLDEPLGQLDSLTRITMQRELVGLWQRAGFTAVMVTHDVEEALLMANRVVVFSERPARIKAVLTVDRPYPRHRDDPAVQEQRREILDLMGFGEA